MRKIRGIIYWSLYKPIMKLCVYLFYYLPVKNNKIIFFHDFGNGYGDSPKYIAEEIIRRGLKYDMVWVTNNDHNNAEHYPKQIRRALISRISSVYELATAKVIITTGKYRYNLKKKKTQFFVYAPHGQIGAKYVEAQAGGTLGKDYIEGSKWHSSVTDLTLSSSKLFTEEVRNYYWYPDGEIAEIGLPRNDIFFNYTKDDVVCVKKSLGINVSTKILIYAPTFRNEKSNEPYAIDTKRLLNTLERKFGGEWLILVRMHPCFIWYGKAEFDYSDKVIDVTNYPDMQDLLLISDICISDYSSTMFDFNLMHRPVFLFTTDIPQYQKMRGLKDWFFKVPFPFCKNNDELNKAIEEYDEQSYSLKCKEFDKLYGSLENGKASELFVNRLQTIMQ